MQRLRFGVRGFAITLSPARARVLPELRPATTERGPKEDRAALGELQP